MISRHVNEPVVFISGVHTYRAGSFAWVKNQRYIYKHNCGLP